MATTIIESLFQRNLEDLVKGLRVQMIGEARYIADHLEEIRKEIKSADAHTKTVALQKLTYINMLHGVDMEWAAFHVVEVEHGQIRTQESGLSGCISELLRR